MKALKTLFQALTALGITYYIFVMLMLHARLRRMLQYENN